MLCSWTVCSKAFAELHAVELEHQAEDALTFLGALHVSKKSFDVFEELAHEMGSRQWERITTMAESALAAGNHDLAMSVFSLRTSEASTETTFVSNVVDSQSRADVASEPATALDGRRVSFMSHQDSANLPRRSLTS
jgi:hypothetical protein